MTQKAAAFAKRRALSMGIPLRLLRELRMEAHLFAIRCNPLNRVNAGKLAALSDIKLNLGPSSQTLPGWVNVDGWRGPGVDLVCDLRQRLPFTDGSCHLIFSEHVLEHIDLQFRARVLTEWRRLIAPNGRVRVVVPSSRRATEAYARGDTQWFIDALGVNSRNDGLNNIFNQHFHKYIDDFDSLSRDLRNSGFERVWESSCNGSDWPELRVDRPWRFREIVSLYVEAEP